MTSCTLVLLFGGAHLAMYYSDISNEIKTCQQALLARDRQVLKHHT